jgi:hypothetical protein
VAALVVVLGTMGAVMAASSRTYELTGSLTAPSCDYPWDVAYADVTVEDENGTVIATTATASNLSSLGCEVEFTADVPKANYYTVTIGTHDGPVYSFEELEQLDFELLLTLGGSSDYLCRSYGVCG